MTLFYDFNIQITSWSAARANFTNAGIVAPGYSPGVITVTGDVTNTGTYQLELSATETNGTFNDRIEFYGVADLNNGGTGKIVLSKDGVAALPFGQRYVLFKGLTPANVAAAEPPARPVPTTSTVYFRLFAGLTSLEEKR